MSRHLNPYQEPNYNCVISAESACTAARSAGHRALRSPGASQGGHAECPHPGRSHRTPRPLNPLALPRRVRRLARAAGLACVHPRPYKATTVQDKAHQRGLADLAGRQFVPERAGQLWYGDITYIHTISGWAYMATVIDGYSRKVIGWSVADHMREELVLDAMKMAIRSRRPEIGEVVFHSDRGSQGGLKGSSQHRALLA
jgi:transposase InsO family protein